ncbi:MAG: glycosyltransferase, partial [Patescibacteria group bacterium]|nr:glycosyltransferase [Patescibacteria group bacterium]
RSELLELFRTARAVVYPSTFEGFGMPVAEAMAAGVPLACSDIEPLKTLALGAAILFDPHNEAPMLEAMEAVIVQPAPAVAGELSLTWARSAELTLQALARSSTPDRM